MRASADVTKRVRRPARTSARRRRGHEWTRRAGALVPSAGRRERRLVAVRRGRRRAAGRPEALRVPALMAAGVGAALLIRRRARPADAEPSASSAEPA